MASNIIEFSLNAIGPIVILLMAGKLLYAQKQINDAFISVGSNLVFNFALPALLFVSISQANFEKAANWQLMGLGLFGTLIFFVGIMLLVHLLFSCREDRGVIVQASFRANLGVVGLAYASNTFGAEDFAQASVYMGSLVLIYNVLSVWVLNHYLPNRLTLLQTGKAIIKTPIILSIIVGLFFSFFDLPLPALLYTSTEYFAQLTLPLALICTGASIRFRGMGGHIKEIIFATIAKCIVYPSLMIMLGLISELNQIELLTILFMAVAPTAVVSFVMVKKMGGNSDLAANIVAIATLTSMPTTLIGYSLLML